MDSVAAEAIVAGVNAQYVKNMEEYYVGYNNQTIKTMIKQIQKWYVIITKEKIAIKAH